MERDAVHKALMSLLRQDVKGNFHVKTARGHIISFVSCFSYSCFVPGLA